MSPIVRHVLIPAVAPAAIVGLYFTPVELVGCANRGLAALSVAGLSAVGSVTASVLGAKFKRVGKPDAEWWFLTAVILTTPLALLIGPLG